MTKDLYSRLATSVPVDAAAARAVSMRGEHEPTIKIEDWHKHYDAPPKTFPTPSDVQERTGRKFGRLTVIGFLYGQKKGTPGSRWLVRCVCGQYEVRRGKIIDRADADQCCARCRTLAWHRTPQYQRSQTRQAPAET